MSDRVFTNMPAVDYGGKETPRSELVPGERLKTSFFLSSHQAQVMDVESAERVAEFALKVVPRSFSYEEMLDMFEKVGDGWHDRDEHKNGRRAASKKLLESKKTFSWELMSGDEPIGFCVAVQKGFGPDLESMVHNFTEAANLKPGEGVEIYKIALYREHTGKKLGRSLFPMLQDRIFKGQDDLKDVKNGADIPKLKPAKFIFLSTTIGPKFPDGTYEGNLVDSREHYKRLGYSRVGENRFTIHAPFSDSAALANGNADQSGRGQIVLDTTDKNRRGLGAPMLNLGSRPGLQST